MNVVHVLDNTSGGLVHYTAQLVNALSELCDICLICQKGMDRTHFHDDIRIVEMNLGATKEQFVADTLVFPRFLNFVGKINEEEPDIVHIQEHPPWVGMTVPLLARRYPIVITVHDVNPHLGERQWAQQLGRWLYYRYADAIFVHGEWARRQLLHKSKPPLDGRVFSIPMGSFGLFQDVSRGHAAEEPDTVLFFGRIEAYKGLEYLIDAIAEVSRRIPTVKLIIAGGGDLGPYRDKLTDTDHFEVHNHFIPDAEVAGFFQRATIVVLPYVECTQTGVIPVAYAFRKPVVATEVGSVPELVDIGRTGLMVPPRDAGALARAIEHLLGREDLRTTMGEAGHAKLNGEMSWEHIARKTMQVYRRTIEAKDADH